MKHALHILKCFAKTFILSLCCLLASHLFSQTIDSSFAVNGKLILPIYNDKMYSGSILYQGDKLLVSSWDEDVNRYYPGTEIFRLNTHGNIDSTFGDNGRALVIGLTGAYLAVQNDKKILVTGGLSERDGPDPLGTNAVYRFLPSGKPDLNFGVNGRFAILLYEYSRSLSALAVKDNGKILAAGSQLRTRNDSADITVIQINKNGSLDSNFGTKGFIYKTSPYEGQCYALKILPNQEILAGFTYTIEKKVSGTSIIRYKVNGSIDSSFGINGVVLVGNRITKATSDLPVSISLARNDKIIVYTADSSEQGVLCRYTKLGKPDVSFGINGRVAGISHYHTFRFFVTTDSANRILLNQTVGKGVTSVARFKTNGKPDSSFGVKGVLPKDTTADAILVAPDTKLIVYGSLGALPPIVIRYKFDSLNALQNDAVSATSRLNLNENIVVYPNPSTNILHISGLKSNSSYALNVIDAKGNIVTSKQATGDYDLNVQQLSSGVYYLNIFTDGKTYSQKFIKE